MSTPRGRAAAAGTANSAFCAAGATPGATAGVNNTEEWDFTSTITAGSWSSSNNMNTARASAHGTATGPATAAMAISGGTPQLEEVEEYDGTSWTEVGDVNSTVTGPGTVGTQAAALKFLGTIPPFTVNNEEWDGSSWTEIANVSQSRYRAGAAGTSTSAITYGGTPPNSGLSEEWNGTSWTEGDNMNNARYMMSSGGTQTAAIGAAGYGTALDNETETYDGTSWTETTDCNTARYGVACSMMESTTSGIVAGGYISTDPGDASVEEWDGSAWTEVANIPAGVYDGGGTMAQGGSNRESGLFFGGGSHTATTIEWLKAQNIKVITD